MIHGALGGCLLVILLASAEGANKAWNGPKNVFNDANNWKSGRLPCAADNVSIQSTWTPTSVYVQTDFSVRSLDLPEDGVLILGDTVTINFDHTTSSCSGGQPVENAVFMGQDPGDWDDPNNWKTYDDQNNMVSTATWATADRLPCETDSVSFPKAAVAVRLTHPVKVASLKIANQNLDQATLVQLLKSDSGKGQFKVPSSNAITITGANCTAGSQCSCGNSGFRTVRSACSFLATCSAVNQCTGPVMLQGGCCAYCGGLLNATVDSTFSRTTFNQKVHSFVGAPWAYKIQLVSPTKVQVLLYGKDGADTADRLQAAMKQNPTAYTLPASPSITMVKSRPLDLPVQIVTRLVPVTQNQPAPTTTKPEPRSEAQATTPPHEGQSVEVRTHLGPLTEFVTDREERVVTDKTGNPEVIICGPEGQKGSSSSDNTGYFVAAAVGGVLLLVIIIFIIFVLTKRRTSYGKHKFRMSATHLVGPVSVNSAYAPGEADDDKNIYEEPQYQEIHHGTGKGGTGFTNPTYSNAEQ